MPDYSNIFRSHTSYLANNILGVTLLCIYTSLVPATPVCQQLTSAIEVNAKEPGVNQGARAPARSGPGLVIT
jgi:hypothetical protein